MSACKHDPMACADFECRRRKRCLYDDSPPVGQDDATSRAHKEWLSERVLQTLAVAMETDDHCKDWVELAETGVDALKYHGFQIIDTRTHIAIAREPSDEVVERVARALCGSNDHNPEGTELTDYEPGAVANWHCYKQDARAAIAALVQGQTQGGEDGDV